MDVRHSTSCPSSSLKAVKSFIGEVRPHYGKIIENRTAGVKQNVQDDDAAATVDVATAFRLLGGQAQCYSAVETGADQPPI